MRSLTVTIFALCLGACATGDDLRIRHGSPLHSFTCKDSKTFQSRQIISGEVEVTAGGQTRDAADSNGDPVANGPRLTYAGETTWLTGMPGGPYEACVMDDQNVE